MINKPKTFRHYKDSIFIYRSRYR